MRLFLHALGFELRYYLKRPSTWVYFGLFAAISFLLMNAVAGAFPSMNVSVGGTGGRLNANAPVATAFLVINFSIFGVIVAAALVGNAAQRDFATGAHPLFFTKPIPKAAYVGARFAGSLLVAALIFLSIPLGLLLGSVMPYLDDHLLGPFRAASYFEPYAAFVLPNLLVVGAIFFGLALYTRQMLPNYIGAVVLIIGYLLASELTSELEHRLLSALADPFGAIALIQQVRYWTLAEQNTLGLPFEGYVLWNRLLWTALGAAIFAGVYARFRFAHGLEGRRRPPAPAPDEDAVARPKRLRVPQAARSFGTFANLARVLSLARREVREIARSRYFVAIIAAGILFLIPAARQVGRLYGTTTYPVTYATLEVVGGTFALFMIIILALYSGELVWRDRDLRASQLGDTLPVPDWVPYASKILALGVVIVLLMAMLLVVGVVTQTAKGYTNYELGLYARTLFGLHLADYLLLAVLALAVHAVVNHKYVGHFIIVLYFVFSGLMGQFGLEHNLIRYGSDAGMQYSDMNAYGPFLAPFAWFKLYWAGMALLLAAASNVFWVRGEETGRRFRLRLAGQRFLGPARALAVLGLVVFSGTGAFIFYNTNVLNEYRKSFDSQATTAEYERRYKQYEGVPQPRISAVYVEADIFPERRDVELRGHYRLVNRTGAPVDSVHLRIPRPAEIRRLDFDRGAEPVLTDTLHGYHIHRLAAPLAPGDSMRLDFELAYLTRGFANRVANLQVVENGTFFNSGLLPGIGYDPSAELATEDTRRKHGLEPKDPFPPMDDPDARMRPFIGQDADWIEFEALIGTSPDQIAIAPGYLQREWEDDGRRYFHYRMDTPILNFYSFLSARYEVRRDSWNDVAIEIFYHPGHEYNLDRMVDGVKASLEYFTREFGPYQHRQVRIIEFPRYRTFAQSFPNTIPYSEGIGFIARIEKQDDIDYVFYVTAHEVAHQWFGHQLIGAPVQGVQFLSESLSQYGALMVMEHEYGPDQMKRFLRHELDRYLWGRSNERRREMPLKTVEMQSYVYYQKGSLVMYALRDYLGEERLNVVIREFLEENALRGAPYPTTGEFVERLRAATPDSLAYLVEDMLETITLFENRAVEATYRERDDGRFDVHLVVEARKLRADTLGVETEIPVRDWIDIGVFGEERDGRRRREVPLYLEKHRIDAPRTELTIVVDEQPVRAGIDPYHKLIDRQTQENVIRVRREGEEDG